MVSSRPKVVLFQYRLFHYREDMLGRLKSKCEAAGIDLHLVVGQPFGQERTKNDEGSLPWAQKVRNLYFPVVEKKDLCWQPCPRALKDADLVIVMQENRLLANYWWMLKRRVGGPKVAYWGHGRDFQTNAPGGLRERFKEAMIAQVDWWFAYTRISVDVLLAARYPEERITCLNNAIDTQQFKESVRKVSADERSALMQSFGWAGSRGPVALFCGSLYPDKKLDLLIEAADAVKAAVPQFKLIIVGDGSSAPFIRQTVESREWCIYVGAKRGQEKALHFAVADLVLNPGLVGLHVLDAFAAGLPMVTTRGAKHSPEIAYLESGRNGLITDDSATDYAAAVVGLLREPKRLGLLKENALVDADRYTVERMAENFTEGIVSCLATPKKGRVFW